MDAWFWEQQLSQFIFVLANNADTVFLGALATLAVTFGPVGRALASRLRRSSVESSRIEALEAELLEINERADFNERLLGEIRNQLAETGQPIERRAALPETPTPV